MANASAEDRPSELFESRCSRQLLERQGEEALEPWLLLRAVDGLGDRTFCSLIERWKNPGAVLRASRDELIQSGCSSRLADAIRRGPSSKDRHRIDHELAWLLRTGVGVRTFLDRDYPARLRMIPDPPPLLYVSGTLTDEDDLAVAVVGARRATAAGRMMTEELARELAESGVTVVSGLARGIDAAAHRGALAGGGRTVAVLGCGIDHTYPSEHGPLRREIEARGAVVSELPVGTSPEPHNFPRRNRIISGLSLGIVVTEAAINSGSLITARLAADQGREVFAVPGFVKEETSRGTNALLKEGATLVERAKDVIESLTPQLDSSLRAKLRQRREENYSDDDFGIQERLVYDALSHEPKTVDRIVEETRLEVATVMAVLLSLELLRRARQLSGQRFLRA